MFAVVSFVLLAMKGMREGSKHASVCLACMHGCNTSRVSSDSTTTALQLSSTDLQCWAVTASSTVLLSVMGSLHLHNNAPWL